MIQLLGVIGAIAFAICGLPQAWQSFKTKSSQGVNVWFLLLWLFGEIITMIYVLLTVYDWILLSNYIVNILFLFVIMYYKFFPKEV